MSNLENRKDGAVPATDGGRGLTPLETEMLEALKAANIIIGEIPSGVLGTQEPSYRALVRVDAAIAKATGA